jgi:hypothetical protein
MNVAIKENVWKASVYVIQEPQDMIAVKGIALIIVMEEEVSLYYYIINIKLTLYYIYY